jgi:hypothetical protein
MIKACILEIICKILFKCAYEKGSICKHKFQRKLHIQDPNNNQQIQ